MPPTLARRYFFKLLANVAAVPVYLVMEAILPRALGPQMYGNYSYATAFFQQLSGFLDMGTSTCFYNSLSCRQHDSSLFAFYIRIAVICACALLLFGGFCLYQPLGKWLLPDMPLWLAPLAAIWAFLTWYGRVLRSANDALGVTINSEIWRTIISLLAVILLCCLFFTDNLTIATLFAQQYLLLFSTCIAFWLVCKKHWHSQGIHFSLNLQKSAYKTYGSEFFTYSHPLLVQALLSFLMLTLERWLLQWFDGSAQQGFFALSQKVSMACFLFVSAMTPLLMREFSVAWGKGDLNAMGRLLSRFAPALYAIAAYFSCFTLAEGKTLVELFGGEQFLAATLPVQIMALYPLHQAYGQMAGSVFHASGKTKILRNLTACECVYGLATAWFLLAPPNLGGLNLGATGLAIKTVGVQFVSVNICLWLASRMIPFSFWRNLLHQMLCAFIFTAIAFLANVCSMSLFMSSANIWRFIASGCLYTFCIIILTLLFPRIIGLGRNDLFELYRRVARSLRRLPK